MRRTTLQAMLIILAARIEMMMMNGGNRTLNMRGENSRAWLSVSNAHTDAGAVGCWYCCCSE